MKLAFRYNKRGATAVEFALIAPVLIAMIMGMLEFGCIFFTYISAEYATGDVARQIAANHLSATANATISQQVQTIVQNRLPKWASSAATASANSSGSVSPIFWTVITTIPMKAATPTNFFISIYGSKNITVKNVVLQEPSS